MKILFLEVPIPVQMLLKDEFSKSTESLIDFSHGILVADLDNFKKAFQRAYAKDLILPTAQEFADFQEEMRMQRRLRNLEDENDPADSKQCAYFSGRRNNEAGYIEDTIIKDSEGCLKELPYTCVLYLPDKGSSKPL